MPKSAEQFQLLAARLFLSPLVSNRALLDKVGFGYKFDQETREELDEAMDDLINAFRNSRVVFNQSKRAAELAKIRCTVARADTAFQTFLACQK